MPGSGKAELGLPGIGGAVDQRGAAVPDWISGLLRQDFATYFVTRRGDLSYSIDDMRRAYFEDVRLSDSWIILSAYYFGDDKANKVITFTSLPYLGGLPQLQSIVRALAPGDIKHTRSIDGRFIEFLRQLPSLNISFIFQQDKYFAWTSSDEFQGHMAEFCETLSAYVAFWQRNTMSHSRLDALSRNILHAQDLLRQKKKIRNIIRSLCNFLTGWLRQ